MANKKTTPTSYSQTNIFIVCVLVLLSLLMITKAHRITSQPIETPMLKRIPFDFNNQSIMLNDEEITFSSGTYTSSASATEQQTTSVSDRTVSESGTKAAAIITDSSEGSGTFSYLIGAMIKDGTEVYSEPVSIGDRIKIVSVTVTDPGDDDNGTITVEYLDRAANAPLSAEPTKEMTAKYAFEDNGNLMEVLK